MSWLDDDYDTGEQKVGRRSSVQENHSDPLVIQPILGQHERPADMMEELTRAWSNGFRFKDINIDRGIYDIGSATGVNLVSQSAVHSQKADVEIQKKQYKDALSLYTKALEFSVKIVNNGEHLGRIFSKRSRAYYLLKDFAKALNDALAAVRCYPIHTEGSVRLAEALDALGKYEESFTVCTRANEIYIMEDERSADYLKLAVKLSSKVQGGLTLLAVLNYADAIWHRVLKELTKEGSWSTVRIVLMGTDDLTPLVSDFDGSELELAGLVESCRETSWRDWGQKLAQLLIRQGARYQSLCAKGKYPFHVALKIGLRADSFELLKWLLGNKADQINSIKDESGNSLLHIACRSNSSAKCTAIKLLLNHSIDTRARNADGKIPLDYLGKQDPGYDVISKHMEKTAEVAQGPGPRPGAGVAPGSLVPVGSLRTGPGIPQQSSVIMPQTQIILNFEHIISWSKTKVQKWLETSNLSQHKRKFKDVDGPLLYEMKMMQNVAPEMFYKVLEESLELSLIDLLKVSFSLRQIREDNPK